MSSRFGEVFRIATFGESHGGGVGVVVDGCPPRLPLSAEEVQKDLDRRRPGQSRLTTPRAEADRVEILSGVFEGLTIGSPIAMLVKNQDARRESRDKIVEDMFQELEAKLHDIGINEEAEQSLIELTKTRVGDISSLYNTGAEIENRFTGLVDRLEQSVDT